MIWFLTLLNVVSPEIPTADLWVRSLQMAYGDRLGPVVKEREDWVIELDNRRFIWAEGRLLPQELASKKDQYASHSFYEYGQAEPNLDSWTPQQLAEAEARILQRERSGLSRHPEFFDTLWRIDTRKKADDMVKTTYFLGFKLQIHRDILEDLAQVEERILKMSRTRPALTNWIKSLKQIDGYNWRPIAGTANRSLHSYGLALDLQPKSYGGKTGYWRWAVRSGQPWLLKAWKNRWMVPAEVVEAFEAEGFIWGGKWIQFDTIHFEYRPELLVKQAFTLAHQLKNP